MPTKSVQAGLTYSVSVQAASLKHGGLVKQMERNAPTAMAALAEAMTENILTKGAVKADEAQENLITGTHVRTGIMGDKDLAKAYTDVVFVPIVHAKKLTKEEKEEKKAKKARLAEEKKEVEAKKARLAEEKKEVEAKA